jgi:hypothetical protein
MKRWFYATVMAACLIGYAPLSSHAQSWSNAIKSDQELMKDPKYWRSKAPWAPSLRIGVGLGFTPNYFSPGNAQVDPYMSTSVSVGMGIAAMQLGVRGYWSDLRLNIGWGFSKALTENIMGGQYARQLYARDIGISLGKSIFRERNSGITLSAGVSFVVPLSLRSTFTTMITSIAPGLSLSKTFFGRLSLSYNFGANFNFYQQDAPVYDPAYQGIPGLNQRWGMSHSFHVAYAILPGLRVSLGLNIGVGFSFADAYQTTDGPQVFGAENLTAADVASYSINESNGYSVFAGIGYRLNRFLSIRAGWSNGGRQYEFQFNDQGERVWQIRNPFRLQNNRFSFSIGGSI